MFPDVCMKRELKVGDKVRAIEQSHGWGKIRKGDEGVVVSVDVESDYYQVDFPRQAYWSATAADLQLLEPTSTEECILSLYSVLGELTSTDEIVWGDKYQHKDQGVVVCTEIGSEAHPDHACFRTQLDSMVFMSLDECIKEPVVPEYLMPKVGDLIRVTHEHAYTENDVVTEYLTPKVGYVIDVSNPAVCIKPALTMHDEVSGHDLYIMLPTWTIITNP